MRASILCPLGGPMVNELANKTKEEVGYSN